MSTYECEYCGMPACDCPVVLYRAFVAAFDAVVPHTFAEGGRFVAVTLADWERIGEARAALNDAMAPEHATAPAP